MVAVAAMGVVKSESDRCQIMREMQAGETLCRLVFEINAFVFAAGIRMLLISSEFVNWHK